MIVKNLRSVQRRMYLSLSIAILVISILNHGVQVISALLQGHLLLYLDILCTQPSTINPTISLALNTCLNTLGVSGIVVQNQPSCTSGNATLIMYEDIACPEAGICALFPIPQSSNDNADAKSVGVNAIDADTSSGCFFDFPDVQVPAVMFSCQDIKDDPPAESTSTVSAATTKPAMTIARKTTGSPTSAATTTSRPSATSKSLAPAKTSNTASSPGLPQSDQIALGVGLPVAAIVVALLAWCIPKLWSKKKKKKKHGGSPTSSQPPLVPPRWF